MDNYFYIAFLLIPVIEFVGRVPNTPEADEKPDNIRLWARYIVPDSFVGQEPKSSSA
jgi:hypothetical protein